MKSPLNNYIATFFSHYDALTFFNLIKERDMAAKISPVPRKVSASCGTCVSFASDSIPTFQNCEIEAIYIETNGKYSAVWTSDNDYHP